MPVRPCPDALDCPSDQPLDNFSSEADDGLDYISTVYKYIDITGKTWNRTECGVTVVSTVSQVDADQRAAAATCPPCEGAGCGNDVVGTTFCNAPQTACVLCADGSSSSCYTVPGGLFCGFLNQESADSAAANFAHLIAVDEAVCLSPLAGCTCVGSNYSRSITANRSVLWEFFGGSLPPGISFFNGVLSGIPTANGQYTFAIKAISAAGTFTVKHYTITVLEITTTVLPAFTIGVPYSFQLQAAGGSGNYLWKIAAGTLPPGLVMNNSGLISGTPV